MVLGAALAADRGSTGGDGPRSTVAAPEAPQPERTTTSSPTDTQPSPPPTGVVPDPDDLLVLVDHDRFLPEGYTPDDLALASVPFISDDVDARQFLRRDASDALVRLFAAAEADGLPLLGVSGFRSSETQARLFADYVARDGEEAAERYSARPGHSEHQTGLAVDVVGIDGECPALRCFADRPEAAWLSDHAHEHGFIVRYPEDGEAITGYLYEPWHLRYVGASVAAEIHRDGITLEEHLGTD